MKRIRIPQYIPVTGDTPEKAASKFNQLIIDLAPNNPTVEREGDTYYIKYFIEYQEPESLAEQYAMKGERHKCIECGFCSRDLNRSGEPHGRKKWATCTKTNERIRIDESVCDEYYRDREELHRHNEGKIIVSGNVRSAISCMKEKEVG